MRACVTRINRARKSRGLAVGGCVRRNLFVCSWPWRRVRAWMMCSCMNMRARLVEEVELG